MDEDAWRKQLEAERAEKDRLFKQHPRSPIPVDERDGFEGLAYFPPELGYRFEVELDASDAGEKIDVPRTAGDTVTYETAGRFHLGLPVGEVTLTAYRTPNHDGSQLFIPFRDATSGETTYGAGRYLEAERHGELWLVDLNRAYHPFCAYDDAYTCPLPPFENHLDVPVEAGERLPDEDAG